MKESYIKLERVFEKITSYTIFADLEKSLQNSLSPTNINVKHRSDIHIHHSHIACKKDIPVRFNESIEFYRREDGKFCQDILDRGLKFGCIDSKLVYYT